MRRAALTLMVMLVAGACSQEADEGTITTTPPTTVTSTTTMTGTTTTAPPTTTTTVPTSALDGIVIFTSDTCPECPFLRVRLQDLAGEVPVWLRPPEEGMIRLPVVVVQFQGKVSGRWEGQVAVNSAEAIAAFAGERWPEWQAILTTGTAPTTTAEPPTEGCRYGDGIVPLGFVEDSAPYFTSAGAVLCVQLVQLGPNEDGLFMFTVAVRGSGDNKESVRFTYADSHTAGVYLTLSTTYPPDGSARTGDLPLGRFVALVHPGAYYLFVVDTDIDVRGTPEDCHLLLCELGRNAKAFNTELVEAIKAARPLPSGTGWFGMFIITGTNPSVLDGDW